MVYCKIVLNKSWKFSSNATLIRVLKAYIQYNVMVGCLSSAHQEQEAAGGLCQVSLLKRGCEISRTLYSKPQDS